VKWNKRLKLLRISKIVIPIALAISIIFIGFSVYADDAQNFVIRTKGSEGINLSLSMNSDLSDQTVRLIIPVDGKQTSGSFNAEKGCMYDVLNNEYDINDITNLDGINSGNDYSGDVLYYSVSFYLINNSDRAVDVDMTMNLDGLVTNGDVDGSHVDDVLRVMLIEGTPKLTDETYTIYAKSESSAEDKAQLIEDAPYSSEVVDFVSDSIIFERTGDNAVLNLGSGESRKFTIVFWLEGWDPACNEKIYGEMAKMSIDFSGR
jgi:hypothetical protein